MKLDVKFSESKQSFKADFQSSNTTINADFGEVVEVDRHRDMYTGQYEAIPAVNSQTFATAQKVMERDFTVLAVPYAEVKNQSNGKTVTIL